MKGRGGVKSAQAAFALVCTLVPALFGRAGADLSCRGSGNVWNVYDPSGCRAADINEKFSGAKVVCFQYEYNNYLASNSAANAQATINAINKIASHAKDAAPPIRVTVSVRARIFVLCSDPAFG